MNEYAAQPHRLVNAVPAGSTARRRLFGVAVAAAAPPAGGRRQEGRAMLRLRSRCRSVTRLLVLALALGAALLAGTLAPAPAQGQPSSPTSVQPSPHTAGHPLIGSWLLYETNPPVGGAPVLAGVATFFAESTVVMIFGDESLQGAWIPTGPRTATVTAVAPSAGGFSELNRLRAAVEVATDGGPMRGTYSFDQLRANGDTAFTYRGPLEGRRVVVQVPDPYP